MPTPFVAVSPLPIRFLKSGEAGPKLSQNSRIVGNRSTVIVGAGFIPAPANVFRDHNEDRNNNLHAMYQVSDRDRATNCGAPIILKRFRPIDPSPNLERRLRESIHAAL